MKMRAPRKLLKMMLAPFVLWRIKRYLKLYRSFFSECRHPRLWTEPEGNRVLVLAPHPDDEVIGCGGTLYKHACAGHAVTIVYMTDGCKGDPLLSRGRLPAQEAAIRSQQLVLQRREEAQTACAILNMKDLVFLDYPDSELKLTKESRQAMAAILARVRPDVVYLPFAADNHPDHRQTNRIFTAAMKRSPMACVCCGYEVWTPLPVNLAVDISDVVNVKTEALWAYRSQLEHTDFVQASLSLNSYRAITAGTSGTHAEAFFRAPADAYIRLSQWIGTGE